MDQVRLGFVEQAHANSSALTANVGPHGSRECRAFESPCARCSNLPAWLRCITSPIARAKSDNLRRTSEAPADIVSLIAWGAKSMRITRAKCAPAIFSSALLLSGCATAPFWPMGGRVTPPPAYGTAASDACSTAASDETLQLECARREVARTINDYARSRSSIEQYKNGTNLALFGAATAGGVNAVTKGSREGLQTLALSAAGLVGLDGSLNADGQHRAYGAGLDALQCVVDIDLAFDEVSAHAARTAASNVVRTSEAVDLLRDAAQGLFQTESARATPQAGLMMYETHERRMAVLNAKAERANAASQLRRLLATRTKTARAQDLIIALNDVKKAVGDHLLYKHEHLAGIYGSITSALKAAAPAAKTAQEGENAGRRVAQDRGRTMSALTSELRSLRGQSLEERNRKQKAIENLRTAEADDDVLLDATRRLSNTYEACARKAQQMAPQSETPDKP